MSHDEIRGSRPGDHSPIPQLNKVPGRKVSCPRSSGVPCDCNRHAALLQHHHPNHHPSFAGPGDPCPCLLWQVPHLHRHLYSRARTSSRRCIRLHSSCPVCLFFLQLYCLHVPWWHPQRHSALHIFSIVVVSASTFLHSLTFSLNPTHHQKPHCRCQSCSASQDRFQPVTLKPLIDHG